MNPITGEIYSKLRRKEPKLWRELCSMKELISEGVGWSKIKAEAVVGNVRRVDRLLVVCVRTP